jgi:hypothetical protein
VLQLGLQQFGSANRQWNLLHIVFLTKNEKPRRVTAGVVFDIGTMVLLR